MITRCCGLNLTAMDTFINQISVFPLQFMTIFTFPIFSSRNQCLATRTFNGESSENKKRDACKDKKWADKFELDTGGELIKFAGSRQNDIEQKCNGRDGEEFKTKMKIDIFQRMFFHWAGSIKSVNS